MANRDFGNPTLRDLNDPAYSRAALESWRLEQHETMPAPVIMTAADLRAAIALALLRAEFAAETVESADWLGEAPELDSRLGYGMESE